MTLSTTLQDRPFGPEPQAQIQYLMAQADDWSRYRLSRELARLWDWRTPSGQLKDMAARTLLLKLHQPGWIKLPPSGARPRPVPGGLPTPRVAFHRRLELNATHVSLHADFGQRLMAARPVSRR